MANFPELVKEIQERLRLRTKVIGYKRLENKADLEKIGGDKITDLPGWSTFCQVPFYARVLGATQSQIFRKILIPAAMPAIITGMRIGLGIAWMCLVSAEMLPGSLSGIGYMITHAFTLASTDIVIAGMISIGCVGALMDMVFRRVEKQKFSWQRQTNP